MQSIEPGILSVSRWFLGLMWLLITCGLMGEIGQAPLPLAALLSWGVTGGVFIYLLWGWLGQKLGDWYMPLALLVLSFAPIVIQWLQTIFNLLRGITGDAALSDPAGLYFWLLLPLVVISSQYGIAAMFGFTISTALSSIILFWPLEVANGPDLSLTSENAIVRFMLFSILGAIVVRVTQAQRAHRRELAAKNQQLAHYAATLEQLAISRERNRLARELHDTLAHTLSALTIQLGAVEALWDVSADEARQKLEETRALARSGLSESRRALQALRAQPLEDLGLTLALDQLARQTAERGGLTLHTTITPLTAPLTMAREQSIYRLAEEALTNVLRHAQAERLFVGLRILRDDLHLRIQDDGIGFDPQTASHNGHYGLVGMRERALLCGGRVDILSQPNQGTCIDLYVPFSE